MHIFKSKINSIQSPAQEGRIAAAIAKDIGISQQQIALSLGINQSQVSRIFRGQTKRKSSALDMVCNYVRSKHRCIKPEDVIKNQTLLDALAEVWDGTEQDAQAIADVIRSLRMLRHSFR